MQRWSRFRVISGPVPDGYKYPEGKFEQVGGEVGSDIRQCGNDFCPGFSVYFSERALSAFQPAFFLMV